MMRFLLALVITLMASTASAQITVPHTLADGETIDAARLNTNFSTIAGDACNRTGCAMTGSLTARDIPAASHNTYDIGSSGTRFRSAYLQDTLTAGTSTFSTNVSVGGTLGVTGATTLAAVTANGALDVNSTFTVGSGNVEPFTAGGKIQAISSTYFDNLSGTNLTGVGLLASNNTWTARQDLTNYTEKGPTATISSGTLTLDLATATHFEVSLNANITTLTISNIPAPSDGVVAFTVKFTADGTLRTISWPGTVKWPGNVAPTMTSTNGKIDVITFISYDAGTSWLGFVGGQNF